MARLEHQHAIQYIEGFTTGINPKAELPLTEEQKKSLEVIREMTSFVDLYKDNLADAIEESVEYGNPIWDNLSQHAKTMLKYFGRRMRDGQTIDYVNESLKNMHESASVNLVGEDRYRRQAGEVEARNVSARLNMSAEERLNTLLSETEDVAREDQIFLRDGVEIAKKKSTEETASPRKSDQPTAISSADGAKILKKLDNLAKKYQEKTNQTKTLIGDLADALDIDMPSKSSKYLTIEAVNGNVVTIRISNHGATASNHDANNEKEAISIVIANKYDGVINDGNAHIIEYFYDAIKLRKAEGKPIVDIIQSIKQALFSGVYIDKTGIAQRIEINAPAQTLTTPNGEMVADVNKAQGQALFSLRTYREGGRDVLADFLGTLVKDGALTEAEAQDMMQQMDDIYAFCETMKDHYAPFGQWSEAKVRISAR